MSVRFLIGPAASGKTHACLTALRAEIASDPVAGPRCFLLVPEQASHQMERALVTPAPGDPLDHPLASHRVEVFSFNRLAFRILDSTSAPSPQALSEPARAMVIAHLLGTLRPRLAYYKSPHRTIPAGQALAAAITELIQEALRPDDLLLGLDNSAADPAQVAKLRDLALIYQAYLDYLGDDWIDPSQYLQLARRRIPSCSWLQGARIWVDGFASLSGQELHTLVDLARLANQMHITILLDPDLASPSGLHRRDTRARLFAKTLRTYNDVQRALIENDIPIESPLILEPPEDRPQRSPALSRLERSLFTSSTPPAVDPDSSPAPCIDLVELPSRRVEVEFAVAQIRRWVSDSRRPLRYRDIAVIARDVSLYHDLLRNALDARGIPFFIDVRRSVAHHPLVELLRGLIDVLAFDFRLDSVQGLLKTGLLPIPLADLDELENYCLEHGLSGWTRYTAPWQFHRGSSFVSRKHPRARSDDRISETIDRINRIRRQFVAALKPWVETQTERAAVPAAAWASSIRAALNHLGVPLALERWTKLALDRGQLDQAQQHRQAWTQVASFIDDLEFAFASIPLTPQQLQSAVEVGLSQITLGLVPPFVDQVLVSSIERSRHPTIKAAIILGLNEGVFPLRPTSDSILDDDDRAALRSAGVRIAPPSKERITDERMLFYIACTRPSDRLVATYALLDEHDNPLAPSPFVQCLIDAVPGLTVRKLGDPVDLRETWDIHTRADLRTRLALEFSHRLAAADDDASTRALWNDLYLEMRPHLRDDPLAVSALANLQPPSPARISTQSIDALYQGGLRTSVSDLETYAQCPHQHFANSLLRLEERRCYQVAPADIGQVHHAIFEEFTADLIAQHQTLADLSDERLSDALATACEKVVARLPDTPALSDARQRYRLRRTTQLIARILQAQRDAARQAAFRIHAAELPFGHKGDALPAWELCTPRGRRITLSGFIDRVDLAELSDHALGIVVDYKTTKDKRLDLSHVYHGISLQLLAYLLVLAKYGHTLIGRPIRPAGAFYLSTTVGYKSIDSPADIDDAGDAAPAGLHRLRGIASAEHFAQLDAAVQPGASSNHFGFGLNRDGSVSRVDQSDGADGQSFSAILAHVERKIGELADDMLDGKIPPVPVRLGDFSPCNWCKMMPACRFEMSPETIRFLDRRKRSEIFRLILPSNSAS